MRSRRRRCAKAANPAGLKAPADLLARAREEQEGAEPPSTSSLPASGASTSRGSIEARQAATREKRIKTAVEWMAEGKIRNWKYVK